MLKFDIEPLVRLYGKSEPVRFLIENGMSRTVARGIAHNSCTRWDPRHMVKLCKIFDCTVNDFVVYVGDDPDHPMAKLERPRIVQLHELLEGKSFLERLRIYEALRKGKV